MTSHRALRRLLAVSLTLLLAACGADSETGSGSPSGDVDAGSVEDVRPPPADVDVPPIDSGASSDLGAGDLDASAAEEDVEVERDTGPSDLGVVDGGDASAPLPEGFGLVDEAYFRGRQLDYLRFATEEQRPGSVLNSLCHMERERVDPDFAAAEGAVDAQAWDRHFEKLAELRDTSDFTALDLLNVLYGYRDHPMVASETWRKAEEAILGFKFWYTQPTAEGLVDDMWYWSENHQVIFHTCELLAGQLFPESTFGMTGMTGLEHQEHARSMLLRWMELRARFGFFEFHSNVYYTHSIKPLLSLVEFAEDEELRSRAELLVDLFLLDLALNTFRGSFGVSHGRSYKKDKMSALDESSFDAVKLLFDTTEHGYQSRGGGLVSLLARAQRYRPPQVLLAASRPEQTFSSHMRMGVAIDEHEPIVLGVPPVAPYGLSYDDERDLPVWWSLSALSVWQVIPLSLDVVERYGLWETELFQGFSALRGLLDAGVEVASIQGMAQSQAHAAAMGLLGEVNTTTYRTPDFMLASAQDYRKGSRGLQHHSWQATLGVDALVFTTHPGEPPRQTTNWRDDGQPGQWTGSASLPRSGQVENVAIHLYSPQYEPLPAPFDGFTQYEPYTHAYFPQDHFDEVRRSGHWTFGRRGSGYVGLWSWREPQWQAYDPEEVATRGMERPFDLRAPGGPQNVWIVECGGATSWESFDAFVDALAGAEVTVTPVEERLPPGVELGPVFDVRYASPSQGLLSFGWTAPLTRDGVELPTGGFLRLDNPWSQAAFDSDEVVLTDPEGGGQLELDFVSGRRRFSRVP